MSKLSLHIGSEISLKDFSFSQLIICRHCFKSYKVGAGGELGIIAKNAATAELRALKYERAATRRPTRNDILLKIGSRIIKKTSPALHNF